jgi:alpha-glucosidase
MITNKNYMINGHDITFFLPKGNKVLRVINESIINVRNEKAEDTIVTEKLARTTVPFEFEENEQDFLIKTSRLIVKIDKKQLSIIFLDHNGNIINQDHEKNSQKQHPSYCYKQLKENELFYGCGERAGFLNKRGEKLRFWNYAEPKHFNPISNEMYKSIPFLISKTDDAVYGLYYDNSFDSFFDLGAESPDYYCIGAEAGELNYYFIYGSTIKEILQLYTGITGRSPLPPLWSLGYHQSKWSYFPEERVYELAKTFREKNIPCDSIHLDIDYMDNYKIFSFNEERFPNPKEMFTKLNEMGFKMIAIVDPGVKMESGYPIYEHGKSEEYFCKEKNGHTFVGDVWPGGCVFPDFTNNKVRSWWADLNKEFLELGISGIWNDLNEPSILVEPHSLPKDVIHQSDSGEKTHGEIHNLYANYEAMATLEGWKNYDENIRPFILSRAGFAGIQKYAAVWTGDNTSSWDQLLLSIPMFINLGLSGIPFVGADVGGYAGNCSEELLIRWMQLGAFTPLFRNHTRKESTNQEPWAFSEKAEQIMKKFIQLRYRLLPYFYNVFRETHETGCPVLRPMFFEYESDRNTHTITDQFLIGKSLLVAPIYLPGQTYRTVYLPEGTWYDYWTNEIHQGRQFIVTQADLETMPLFVNSGSIIPEYPLMNYVGETKIEKLTFNIYCGNGEFVYYEDDQVSNDYIDNKFNKTAVSVHSTSEGIDITIAANYHGFDSDITTYHLVVHGVKKVLSVQTNEVDIEYLQNSKQLEFSIPVNDRETIKINY